MGINTNFKSKNLHVNTSWKRFSMDRDVTIQRLGTFPADTSFFTIGSCFANELRHALETRNLTVLPKMNPAIHHLFPDEVKSELSWGQWDERAQLQFYNTFSIRQEFEKAFGHWTQGDDDFFKVTHGGVTKYWDPYRRAIFAASEEDFVVIKNTLDDSLSTAIHNADATVITLGMTETFFRKDNGLAVCQYNRFFTDRVEFRATTYEENYANIDRICELYFGKYPNKKIVLTVSPVALAQTFTDNDIVVANMESKSTLRTVAAAIARKWPNIIYWPSYEIVMWNDNSWQPDVRHVHPDRVASIMDAFLECHISGMETSKSATEWDERNRKIEQEVTLRTEAMKRRAALEELKKLEAQLQVERQRAARADALRAEIEIAATRRIEAERARVALVEATKEQAEREKAARAAAVQAERSRLEKEKTEARLAADRDLASRIAAKEQAIREKAARAAAVQAERSRLEKERAEARLAAEREREARIAAKQRAEQEKQARAQAVLAQRQAARDEAIRQKAMRTEAIRLQRARPQESQMPQQQTPPLKDDTAAKRQNDNRSKSAA